MIRNSSRFDRVKALEGMGAFSFSAYSHESISRTLVATQPDVVFHLAAGFVASNATYDVNKLLSSNVELTAKICRSTLDSGCKALVTAGSAKQGSRYFSNELSGINNNVFETTKQAADEIIDKIVANSMLSSSTLSATTLKIYDSYGPNDHRRKFLSMLSEAAKNGRKLKAGPSNQPIHIVYVDDLVDGFVHAANLIVDNDQFGRALYTLPSKKAITMRELADLWLKLNRKTARVDWFALKAAEERLVNPWEGEPLPGWEPKVPLKVGLKQANY